MDIDQVRLQIPSSCLPALYGHGIISLYCGQRFMSKNLGYMRLSYTPYDLIAPISADQRQKICEYIMSSSACTVIPSVKEGRMMLLDNCHMPIACLAEALAASGVHSVVFRVYGMKMSTTHFNMWMKSCRVPDESLRYGFYDVGRTFIEQDLIAIERSKVAHAGYSCRFYQMFRSSTKTSADIGGIELSSTNFGVPGIKKIKLYSHVVHVLKSALKVCTHQRSFHLFLLFKAATIPVRVTMSINHTNFNPF
jgi:hypothetical protein